MIGAHVFLLTSCHAVALKQRSLVSEVVLQQTVTVIPPDVPHPIPPIQLSEQIDATVSIQMVHQQLCNCIFLREVIYTKHSRVKLWKSNVFVSLITHAAIVIHCFHTTLFSIFRLKKVLRGSQTPHPPPPQRSPAARAPLLTSIQHLAYYWTGEAVEGPSNLLRKTCLRLRAKRSNCLISWGAAMISWRRCSQRGTMHTRGLSTLLLMQLLWACMTTMTLSNSLWTWAPSG